jgi:CheY-like chemotaxis protein
MAARAHLPRIAGEAEQPPTPVLRVLVVDDHADSAESLALYLSLEGHEVRTAADGLSALRAARDLRPDAVVLDIALPDLDGYEVARALRRDPDLAGVTLVALTGHASPEDARRSREAGFDFHLAKPAHPREVEAILVSGAVPPHARLDA